MAGAIGYRKEFFFCSGFGHKSLFLGDLGDTTVIEYTNVPRGGSTGIMIAHEVSIDINIDSMCCFVQVQ